MPFNRFNPAPGPASKSRSGLSGGISGLVEAEKLMQVAFVLPSAVLIGWAGGWWLSNAFHHKWIEIAGVLFGCVSGLFYVIQTAIAAEKNTRMGDEAQNGAGKGTPDQKS